MNARSIIIYSSLIVIAIASIAWASMLPVESFLKDMAGIPGVIGMVAIILKLLYDNIEFERKAHLQAQKEEFDVAITSHMANVAFDKHVQFCEEYINAMHEAIITLHREGDCEEMLVFASNLVQIKTKYRTWLTSEIESGLEHFEKALRVIGANAHFYKVSPSEAVDAGAVNENHRILKEIFGYHKDGSAENILIRTEEVIRRVRAILGIEELTKLRYKKMGRNQTGQLH